MDFMLNLSYLVSLNKSPGPLIIYSIVLLRRNLKLTGKPKVSRFSQQIVTSSRFRRALLRFVMAELPEVDLAQEDVDIKRK